VNLSLMFQLLPGALKVVLTKITQTKNEPARSIQKM